MGFFDRFKKPAKPEPEEPLFNAPHLLSVKLLFEVKPVIDVQVILAELHTHYQQVDHPPGTDSLLFFFPELEIEFTDGKLPAQCSIFLPDDQVPNVDIKPEAFQQNWHWPEAAQAAERCHYEILVADFMTRTLAYAARVEMFMNFLAAVIKATKPQVVYAVSAQKLLAPASLLEDWEGKEKQVLSAFVNVRLYNIDNGRPGETVMDTIGLYMLGLPDFQIRFTSLNPSAVAGLLWNYAYYLFEAGDAIENGNTLAGLEDNSKWVCNRQMSLVGPERVVLDVQPA